MRPIVEWACKAIIVTLLTILVGVSFTSLVTVVRGLSGKKITAERNYIDTLIDFQSMRINQLAEELRQAEQRILLCEGYVDE